MEEKQIQKPLVDDTEPHELIKSAQSVLEDSEQRSLTTISNYMENYPVEVMPESVETTGELKANHFQKFANLTTQLRNQENVNLYEVKKLNLAAAVETLERSVHSHEAFPSADAGIAVSTLSEQVAKLVKDLEKSQDPYLMFSKIMDEVLHPLTEDMVHNIANEMKWLKQNSIQLVPAEQRKAYEETLKEAVNRIGPSFKESLEVAKTRMLKAMNLKEK